MTEFSPTQRMAMNPSLAPDREALPALPGISDTVDIILKGLAPHP
ncbi:hypothetical protein [Streptomyces griseoluteus]